MLYTPYNTVPFITEHISIEDLNNLLGTLQRRNIPNIFISSPGGTSYSMVAAQQYLSHRNVTTVAGPVVASAALDIFLCGKRRFLLPSSRIMFHRASMTKGGQVIHAHDMWLQAWEAKTTGDHQKYMYCSYYYRALKELDQLTLDLIALRTKLPRLTACKLIEGEGTTLSPQEAVYFGFAHDVISEACIKL